MPQVTEITDWRQKNDGPLDLARALLVIRGMTRSFTKDALIGFGFVAAALGVLIGGQVLLLA